ncbi:PAS domain S-box protein [Balneolaceae bacterium YR4-1]|uniref:PAS domain S-box protein n=1 Tax=Halalkalibaculum roseum TaxID=2709311 RepID=A0A6M1SX59_9BACT|nr:PAS domain S-box protein [Halalkalibaculum roseum]NGP77562.1 PAS domain S-box protein [Halalkalibaculum roseum]
MQSNIDKHLQELSKDEKAYKKLKELFNEVEEEKEKYQQHLNLLESAIQNDYDSILITELDLEKPGPKIVYVNDGFCKMTGYSREEVIGKTPRILQGPKTDRAILDKLKRKLREGQAFFGQAINYRKDGTEFVNQWDIHPLTDSEGKLTHWVSYQHDITERKRAEKVLVDTNVEFDDLHEESKRTVIDVDEQGNIVMANKSFRELVNYDKDELKQIKVWELFPKKYRTSLQNRFENDFDLKNFDAQEFKGIIKHKNGVPIQIKGKTEILELKDQDLIRAEIENISLQKRIMDTLKKRNQNFMNVFEKASEFNYRVTIENGKPVMEYVSEDFPEMTGISPEKVRQPGGLKELVHDDDYDKVIDHFQKILKGNQSTCEYRIRSKEGDYVDIIDYGKPRSDEDDNVICATGAISIKVTADPV